MGVTLLYAFAYAVDTDNEFNLVLDTVAKIGQEEGFASYKQGAVGFEEKSWRESLV
jgi:hypothetical protein